LLPFRTGLSTWAWPTLGLRPTFGASGLGLNIAPLTTRRTGLIAPVASTAALLAALVLAVETGQVVLPYNVLIVRALHLLRHLVRHVQIHLGLDPLLVLR